MRADRTDPAHPSSRPRQPFPKVLGRAVAPERPGLASHDAAHATTAQALQRAQAGHAVTARQLQHARAGHEAHARELQHARASLAVGARELSESRPTSPVAPHDVHERLSQALAQAPAVPTALPGDRGDAPTPTSRVDCTLKLVERIEVFLRSGHPQMELSVGGAFQAEVLLERTGPREVAVMVRRKHSPLPPQELMRLQEELRRRGLKLSSMTVG